MMVNYVIYRTKVFWGRFGSFQPKDLGLNGAVNITAEKSEKRPICIMTYARRRYYTPAEVSQHNHADDCWVSFLGKVYDLTPLLRAHQGLNHL